jgi:predicted unusual protein kinase regulating ubiquinone biosynthesis (AarF/ABC1/UbiB family)
LVNRCRFVPTCYRLVILKPAFDTAIAQQIIEEERDKPISAVLEGELSTKPIAAASLGQVYKAKLRSNGQDVAIKVQRPDIMEKIALDMHLLREFGGLAKKLFAWINTDLVGTVDAWAQGFVDELDYIQEAANGEFFAERIKETPLKDVVFTPAIVHDHTTNAVLVTTWVDGQRLDESSNADVSALCSIAMNTYLTMLLELGVLRKFCLGLLFSLCCFRCVVFVGSKRSSRWSIGMHANHFLTRFAS